MFPNVFPIILYLSLFSIILIYKYIFFYPAKTTEQWLLQRNRFVLLILLMTLIKILLINIKLIIFYLNIIFSTTIFVTP